MTLATPETHVPTPAIERIAEALNRGQLEQLARFLEAPGDGSFEITRSHGYVEVRGSARLAIPNPRAHSGS
jgi:hypothetical protein